MNFTNPKLQLLPERMAALEKQLDTLRESVELLDRIVEDLVSKLEDDGK